MTETRHLALTALTVCGVTILINLFLAHMFFEKRFICALRQVPINKKNFSLKSCNLY